MFFSNSTLYAKATNNQVFEQMNKKLCGVNVSLAVLAAAAAAAAVTVRNAFIAGTASLTTCTTVAATSTFFTVVIYK